MSNNKDLIMESWRKFKNNLNEQAPQQVQTGNVEAELVKAFNAGPAATRAFLNTPLGKSEQVRGLLAKGVESDGLPQDDVVKISPPQEIPVDPAKMLPTQNFIDMMQSISFPLGSKDSLVKAITAKKGFGTIVVDGNLIIDGHHRWSGTVAITPDGKINAMNVTWPGQNTAQKLAAAQLSIAGHIGPGKEIPSAGGEAKTNILGKGATAIAKMVLQYVNQQADPKAPGPLLNDNMMKQIIDSRQADGKVVYDWCGLPNTVTDVKQLRIAIARKVGNNLAMIKSNPQAPGRPDMPQFDPSRGGPELKTVQADLQAGKLNIKPPFTKQQTGTTSAVPGVQKESLKKLVKQVVVEELKNQYGKNNKKQSKKNS